MTLVDYERVADETWAVLAQACDDPNQAMRNVVLATVDERLAPDARLMVLRGADRRLGRIWFHTDLRSPKVAQLRERPAVCVVAWDPNRCAQLRVVGSAAVETTGPRIDEHWRQTAMGLQILLASPDDPGRPLTQPDPRLVGMKKALDAGEEQLARSRFAVVEVAIVSIEWLQVREEGQRRAIMHADHGWAVQPLAP